jgi:hypothetical protein
VRRGRKFRFGEERERGAGRGRFHGSLRRRSWVHCAWICYWAAVSHTTGQLGCLLERMVLGGEGRILEKGDSGKGDLHTGRKKSNCSAAARAMVQHFKLPHNIALKSQLSNKIPSLIQLSPIYMASYIFMGIRSRPCNCGETEKALQRGNTSHASSHTSHG